MIIRVEASLDVVRVTAGSCCSTPQAFVKRVQSSKSMLEESGTHFGHKLKSDLNDSREILIVGREFFFWPTSWYNLRLDAGRDSVEETLLEHVDDPRSRGLKVAQDNPGRTCTNLIKLPTWDGFDDAYTT